jgi:hypothetical protein
MFRHGHFFRDIASVAAAAAIVVLAAAMPAAATSVDLTTGPGASGSLYGAIFEVATPTNGVSAGTGVFQPFVQLDHKGTEKGYNTSASSIMNDGSSANWNRNIQLSQVGIHTVGGVDYFQFMLDINEAASAKDTWLSLDTVQIYTSTMGGASTTTFLPSATGTGESHGTLALGTLRYNADATTDNEILLKYGLVGTGSGRADMTLLVPVSLFDTCQATDYVYLYSHFGDKGTTGSGANQQKWTSCDGFEEWNIECNPTRTFTPPPPPASAPWRATFAAATADCRAS